MNRTFRFNPSLKLLGIAASDYDGLQTLPFFLSPVHAGWPSPAEEYIDRELNLHDLLIKHPLATYILLAVGDSMIGAGIHDGDYLIVDRSVEPCPGKVVIAAVNAELTVKRLVRKDSRMLLAPENPDYQPFDISEHENVHIWGVAIHVIHPL